MLTLKGPIQLHIGQGLTCGAESFGNRILGNYELLRSQYTAEDLLHLLSVPNELPEDLGGMTTLVNQQSLVSQQSVTMDVVNNVVNRILLDGTTQFTYQDQVYITSVLNRLGITNVEQFMEQVRRLRTENETTLHLTQAYQTELKTLLLKEAQGEETPALPLARREEDEEPAARSDPRTELSLSILNRLDTRNLYESVHNFQRRWDLGANTFQNNEFRLSEQLRFSNQLQLNELKQQVYQQPQLHLLHHLNQFETSLLMAEPRSEEEVLTQAAAAALVNAVDQSVVEVLNRPQLWTNQWIQLQNAMSQSTEQTLKRFELYHAESMVLPQNQDSPLLPPENHYLRELQEYQNLYQTVYPMAERFGRAVGVPPMSQLLMTHLTHVQEGEEISQETENHHTQLLIQGRTVLQQLLQNQNVLRVRDTRTERERLLRDHEFRAELTYAVPVEREEDLPLPSVSPQEGTTEILRHLEQTVLPAEPVAPGPVPMTLKEAEEQAPEVLVEQMNQIDQHNRTMMQILHEQLMRKENPAPRTPDMKRTMQEALRALEDPETVLQELQEPTELQMIHQQYSPEEAVLLEQADPTTRALYEKILTYQRDPIGAVEQGLVKPATLGGLMATLKQVELPQSDTELAEQELPVLQPSIPAIRAQEVLEPFRAPQQTTVRETLASEQLERLVHRETSEQVTQELLEELQHQTNVTRLDQQVLEQETLEVLEQVRRPNRIRRTVQEMIQARDTVKIIHKQVTNDVNEELLEQLEQKKSQTVVQNETTEEIHRQTSHQADLLQQERQVVVQTQEDITKLVNQTLSRQMRTISDQVYRQMEKRLQSERTRRGRL